MFQYFEKCFHCVGIISWKPEDKKTSRSSFLNDYDKQNWLGSYFELRGLFFYVSGSLLEAKGSLLEAKGSLLEAKWSLFEV